MHLTSFRTNLIINEDQNIVNWKNVIEVKNLEKYFEVSSGFFSRKKATVKAVDDITFEIPFGESLGLVGQSGCGKTTTARALCLLDPKTGGEVNFYNIETSSK